MSSKAALRKLDAAVSACRRCPRLVQWREFVAHTKKRAHMDETYWGKPVPGFGDPDARVVLIGLAPGAHGANRTGRMFTGDGTDGGGASDFLARALHETGFATQPTSRVKGDGYELTGVFMTAICRCAPPANAPTRGELDNCAPWLEQELALLTNARVLVCLGKLSWDRTLDHFRARGVDMPRARPKFGHGAGFDARPDAPILLASYHPSRQNTAPGRLTQEMLQSVLLTARKMAGA